MGSQIGRAILINQKLSDPSTGVNLVRVSGPGDPHDAPLATLAVLSEEMRWRLYALVRAAHRPVSREEAAASTGISRKLAAFHLDKLVSAGLLRARYDAPLGPRRVGRTPKTYEPSGADIAITIPARRHDVLADILIDAVRAGATGEDPRSVAAQVARAKGAEQGASQRERLRPGRLGAERALTVAGEILDEYGYEPERETPTQLRLRNCPFHPLSARAPDVVCVVNQAYLGGLLDGLGATSVKVVHDPEPGTCCVRLTGILH
jgi:predicted ArsR family transcriptional regulator